MPKIFEIIDTVEVEKGDGHGKLANMLSPTRFYRWNFQHMAEHQPNACSIEFRQPPGSDSVEDAILWPRFALAFISGSIHLASTIDPEQTATLKDLQHFLSTGSRYTWSYEDDWVDELFKGRKQLQERRFPEDSSGSTEPVLSSEKKRIQAVPGLKLEAAFEALPFSGTSDDDGEE